MRVRRRRKALPYTFELDFDGKMTDHLVKMGPPGMLQRKAEYDTLRETLAEGDRFVLADLDHHPGQGIKPSKLFPVQLTHGAYWSYDQERLTTRKEEFSAQGVDMYERLAGGRGISPMAALFDRYEDRHQQELNGNAIHVPSFVAWMFFVLGHIVPVEDFHRIAPAITDADADLDDGGEEEVEASHAEEDQEEEESEEYEYHCQGCGYQDDTGFQSCPVCAEIAGSEGSNHGVDDGGKVDQC